MRKGVGTVLDDTGQRAVEDARVGIPIGEPLLLFFMLCKSVLCVLTLRYPCYLIVFSLHKVRLTSSFFKAVNRFLQISFTFVAPFEKEKSTCARPAQTENKLPSCQNRHR